MFEAVDTECRDDLEREHRDNFVRRLAIRTIFLRCRLLDGGGDPGGSSTASIHAAAQMANLRLGRGVKVVVRINGRPVLVRMHAASRIHASPALLSEPVQCPRRHPTRHTTTSSVTAALRHPRGSARPKRRVGKRPAQHGALRRMPVHAHTTSRAPGAQCTCARREGPGRSAGGLSRTRNSWRGCTYVP